MSSGSLPLPLPLHPAATPRRCVGSPGSYSNPPPPLQMSERIEIANNSWEADTGAGVARRLEEFKMGVSTDR